MEFALALAAGWVALLLIDKLCDVAARVIDGRRR